MNSNFGGFFTEKGGNEEPNIYVNKIIIHFLIECRLINRKRKEKWGSDACNLKNDN